MATKQEICDLRRDVPAVRSRLESVAQTLPGGHAARATLQDAVDVLVAVEGLLPDLYNQADESQRA